MKGADLLKFFLSLVVVLTIPRGLLLWAVTCTIALITGSILLLFPQLQKVLYGRCFSKR